MSSNDTHTMATPLTRITEKSNAYTRFLGWASLNMPGFWRIRLDILTLAYAVLFIGAVTVPITFAGMSGPRDMGYDCLGVRWEQSSETDGLERWSVSNEELRRISRESPVPCAGVEWYSGDIVYTSGFNQTEQGVIFAVFVVIALIFALVWAFMVSRGSRLRDVIGKTNAPGYFTSILALTPLVLLPLLAGHIAFASSHGGLPGSLFTGQTNSYHPQHGYYESDFGGSSSFSLACLVFGAIGAGLLALIMKIIMYDGVVGLIRTALLSAIIGAAGVAASAFTYQAFYDYENYSEYDSIIAMFAAGVVSSIFMGVLWIAYRKDSFKGVRRRMTRPLAFVFLTLWPFFFAYMCILPIALWSINRDYNESTEFVIAIYLTISFFIGAFTEALLFRGIAKISLLPSP